MSLAKAQDADRRGEFEAAAALYEQALSGGEISLQVLLNLALLYWQATDPGLSAGEHLPPAFIQRASRRFPELIEQAAHLYPRSTEVSFWKKYIAWADLLEPLTIDQCRELLRDDPSSLIPAMYIYLQTNGREMRAEAEELLRQRQNIGTAGARYVCSVLEAALKRANTNKRE